jgi:predicted aminopeptidase
MVKLASGGFLCAVLLAGAVLCLGTGCTSLSYYAQAAGGHIDLMRRARPVAEVLADPATPEPLRQRLQASQRMRDFAISELKLPDNKSYRAFADLQREAVVWNVVAAPALSLQLKTWCFPVMGCVGYRGYFQRDAANALAEQLKAEGWEISVYGVPAYSTLGWSDWLGGDPLLSTFINWPDAALAQMVFHELAHQVVYVADDTTFNESFATAVERIGGGLWLEKHGTTGQREEAARSEQRRQEFRALTLRYRGELDKLYRGAENDAAKTVAKAALMAALRTEYLTLKQGAWGGFAGYDGWFERANNASFGVLAAYYELVPGFERLFEREGRDFTRFYAAVRELAALPKEPRRAQLAGLAAGDR